MSGLRFGSDLLSEAAKIVVGAGVLGEIVDYQDINLLLSALSTFVSLTDGSKLNVYGDNALSWFGLITLVHFLPVRILKIRQHARDRSTPPITEPIAIPATAECDRLCSSFPALVLGVFSMPPLLDKKPTFQNRFFWLIFSSMTHDEVGIPEFVLLVVGVIRIDSDLLNWKSSIRLMESVVESRFVNESVYVLLSLCPSENANNVSGRETGELAL